MNIFLSVIVPVYNRQEHIGKCLGSIIKQTYQNIEIVIVDDGSTDDTVMICDKYSKEDNRIRVIHSENCGAIEARKKGVRSARGEVVAFVDSDDWIESDMYENMMRIYDAYSPDIITSGYYINESRDNSEYDLAVEGYYDREQIQKEIVPNMMFNFRHNRHGICPSLCNKLYKKKSIEKIIFSVDPQVSLGDDAAVVYPLIAQADSMYVIANTWYHYMYNNSSMCHTCTVDIFKNILVAQREFERIFDEAGILREMRNQIHHYVRFILEIAIKSVYGVDMHNVAYVFPYEIVPKGSRVVLYGAGAVGNSYWQCLRSQKYATVVAWVDQNYEKISIRNGVYIENPQIISDLDFDFVVIATTDKISAKKIHDYLIEQNVNAEKIVWMKLK